MKNLELEITPTVRGIKIVSNFHDNQLKVIANAANGELILKIPTHVPLTLSASIALKVKKGKLQKDGSSFIPMSGWYASTKSIVATE